MLKEKGNASRNDWVWRQTPRGVKTTTQMYLLASLAANAEGGKNAAQPASYQICGFSLIELMVIIAINSVVSTFVIPAYQKLRRFSQQHEAWRASSASLQLATGKNGETAKPACWRW